MKAIWKKLFLPIAILLLIGITACSHTVPEDAEGKGTMSSQELQAPIQPNIVSATFPAYQDGENEYNRTVYQTAPFTVSMTLPEGWELRQPEEREQTTGNFFTPLELFHGDEYKGCVGFNVYEPYDGDLPPEDYYKNVYSSLLLGSVNFWDGYKPANTTATFEAAVATVNYKDPAELERHPDAPMAEIPYIQAWGVLAYDKDLQVYVGIQFGEDAVTEDQAQEIAKSLSIRPGAAEAGM